MSFSQHQDTELWNYQVFKELRFYGACPLETRAKQPERRKTEKRAANVQNVSKYRSGVGLSNPFYIVHDPPDVNSLDKHTAMPLANSKTIIDDVILTSIHFLNLTFSLEISSTCTVSRVDI